MTEIERAIDLLKTGNATLAAVSGRGEFIFYDKGIKPLLTELDKDINFFVNAAVADRVIGKAAALLMVLAKVNEVYAAVISLPAISVFERFSIPFSFGKKVDRIENRTNTGLCPMESLCMDIDDPNAAFAVLKQALSNMVKPAAQL